jgi:NAD(P)-dependent dehydrogenase (short-subunit alcohol dehydrogenase family)
MTQQTIPCILITGCSTGIGYACAHRLAKQGYQVIATARQQADVQRLRDEGLTAVTLDLTCPQSIRRALETTLEYTDGRLDVLFNNGAYGQPGAVEDISREALREQLETNVLGWHDLTTQVIPIMRRQGCGRIIQNSSVLGLVALPFRGAYVASKFALEGLTDCLRLELAGSGIYVSLIEPGPIISRFRHNAAQAYYRHIDPTRSPHHATYQRMEQRLSKTGAVQPFTLPADAVVNVVVKIITSPNPKPRYYVTMATYGLGFLRRILSTRLLDRLLLVIARQGGG